MGRASLFPMRFTGENALPHNGTPGAASNMSITTGYVDFEVETGSANVLVGFRSALANLAPTTLYNHVEDPQHFGFILFAAGNSFELRAISHLAFQAVIGIVNVRDVIRLEARGSGATPRIWVNGVLRYTFDPVAGFVFLAADAWGVHGPPYQLNLTVNNANGVVTCKLLDFAGDFVGNTDLVPSLNNLPTAALAAGSPQVVNVPFVVTLTYQDLTISGAHPVIPCDHVDLYVDGVIYASRFLGLQPNGLGIVSPQTFNVTLLTVGWHSIKARVFDAAEQFIDTAAIQVEVTP